MGGVIFAILGGRFLRDDGFHHNADHSDVGVTEDALVAGGVARGAFENKRVRLDLFDHLIGRIDQPAAVSAVEKASLTVFDNVVERDLTLGQITVVGVARNDFVVAYLFCFVGIHRVVEGEILTLFRAREELFVCRLLRPEAYAVV